MRHIETQHITPRAYKCRDQQCLRLFNRKDNMEAHYKQVHG